MTGRKTHWEGEGPEPNPVTQIIVARTLQTVAVTLPVLLGLRAVLPPETFGRLFRASGPFVAGALSVYFAATFHSRSPLFSLLSGRGNGFITRLPASAGNAVAFTFDDGPHPDSTPRLLDILARYDARATFFLVGERAVRYPEIVRRILSEGHAIGIHGLRHRTMVLQKPAALRREISEAILQIEEAAGAPLPLPRLLRPPYGFKTPLLARTAARLGCRIIAWSLDPRDYDPVSSERLAAHVKKGLSPGNIVLLHERPGKSVTADALPLLLDLCRERGLECQALSFPLAEVNR
ncbi:MAG: polysaccharide deacetylase family protein [Armatimonadota bacterium]